MKSHLISFYLRVKELKNRFWVKGKPKYFCIGFHKTGTTSLLQTFTNLGYITGNQKKAEWLSGDYHERDFSSLIDYCHTAQFFQDVPFCWPETYRVLDTSFPDARFILTIRSSSEQWYSSFIKYYAALYGNGRLPNAETLKQCNYVYKGWEWENLTRVYGVDESDPYNKQRLINTYEKHNQDVQNYFHDRPEKLLVLDIADKHSYQTFCNFIGVSSGTSGFPWLNKTDDVIPWK